MRLHLPWQVCIAQKKGLLQRPLCSLHPKLSERDKMKIILFSWGSSPALKASSKPQIFREGWGEFYCSAPALQTCCKLCQLYEGWHELRENSIYFLIWKLVFLRIRRRKYNFSLFPEVWIFNTIFSYDKFQEVVKQCWWMLLLLVQLIFFLGNTLFCKFFSSFGNLSSWNKSALVCSAGLEVISCPR